MTGHQLSDAFSPVRRLQWLYIAALSVVALTSLIGQGLVQISLGRQESDARVVNIAGRQRMLSQKLTKTALALRSADDPVDDGTRKRELRDIASLWERSHLGLQFGDPSLGLPGENSPEVRQMFAAIDAQHRAMLSAAKRIVTGSDARELALETRTLLENEAAFLTGMDRIVFQYDGEAKARVKHLTRIELALLGFTLVVLLLEGLLVFRPAATRLRQVIEELWETEDNLRREKAKAERLLAQKQRREPGTPAAIVPKLTPPHAY